jgi:hypothetical protein
MRMKFDTSERVPYYHLFRARAASIGAGLSSHKRPNSSKLSPSPVEGRLQSRNGKVAGRPDFVDRSRAAVVDYKTRGTEQTAQIDDAETRHLRLYAFLAAVNGSEIDKGIIVRADGRRIQVAITADEAREEGQRALEVLADYNRSSGHPFKDAASPSAQNCRFCPCLAFCDRFWEDADSDWAAAAGVHLEGQIASVAGQQLLSLELHQMRGTGGAGPAFATRISTHWLTFDGSPLPTAGETVRIVGALATDAPDAFRADRIATVVWRHSRS